VVPGNVQARAVAEVPVDGAKRHTRIHGDGPGLLTVAVAPPPLATTPLLQFVVPE